MTPSESGAAAPPPAMTRSRVSIVADLLGHSPRRVVELTLASLLSGLVEAGLLAIIAQVAASLASGSHRASVTIGPAEVHSSVGAFLAVAGGFALARLALQVPISV